MAKTRKYKEELVKTYRDNLSISKTVFIVKPTGVTANESVQLKKDLNSIGSNYNVIKNSLFSIALGQEGLPEIKELTQEEHAVVFANSDYPEVAKIVHKFVKDTEKMEIQAGLLEGKYISGDDIVNLAKLPDKQTLLAQTLGMFNAPLTGLMNVISGNTRDLVFVLKSIADKKAV